MTKRVWILWGLALCGFLAPTPLESAVLITEVMYNPPQGGQYEYVELFNSGGAAVNISNWSFTSGITFAFPANTTLAAGTYIVVCHSKIDFQTAYPSVPAAQVFGSFTGGLDNNGERLTLADASQVAQQTVRYGTDPPWDFLADGFGASLERMCFTSDPDDPVNWRASPVPASVDVFGGSPSAANSVQACPAAAPSHPRILISEIMYHPVLEESLEDEHEFIEVWNGEATSQSIAGWRIAGAVDYTFPAGATIAAGAYAVVAKNKTALAAVSSYGLSVGSIFGDYNRTLDNGGEKVALVSVSGQGVDSVTYKDGFPWPSGADALGAADDFLPAALLPLTNHKYRGISLERVSFDVPSSEVANWAPSPLDGATPGKANASARTTLLPIVADMTVQPATSGGTLIRATDQVLIQVRFSPASPSGTVDLQYFVDDIAVTNEPLTTVAMNDQGTGGDLIAGDGVYSATLPAKPDNSIVRFHIRADLEPGGTGIEVVSPRPSPKDAYAWHAYFVSPVINTTTRVYQLFITPANWTTLWDNIQGGRVSGCAPSATWDAKLPAVFVYNGQVTDVRVRYQGSRYNRTNGRDLSSWPYPGPSRPSPVKALSWKISLPAYSKVDGSSIIELNKLTQQCPGYTAGVGFQLFAAADIPALKSQYVRFHINGGYYHYMLQYEYPDEDLIRRYNQEQALKYPDRPKEEVGYLIKSVGCNCDEGPYGWGDERQLFAQCGYTAATRYSYTYTLETHGWASSSELINLIESLNAARASLPDTTALRDYFAQYFDLELLLNYMAIINWGVPFDDMFQNHYLYQRLSDGKWLLAPWDLDYDFGGWKGANASLYMGEENDPDNRSAWWNYLKDAFLKSYRPEFEARLLSLTNTLLHPDNVSPLVDGVTAQANPTEANQSPAGLGCDFPGAAASFKSFAVARHDLINSQLSTVKVDAGPDQTVLAGNTVQFDARASRPDPGPIITYVWSNGITGDFPTFVYNSEGVYTVTLTITVAGIPYQDSVKITVVPAPTVACQETGGQVVIEAESFYLNDSHGTTSVTWVADTSAASFASLSGFSGSSYMRAREASGRVTFQTSFASTAPELKYAVLFQTPGTYRVWLRGFSSSQDADSIHVGIDGVARDESFAQHFVTDTTKYNWTNITRAVNPQELTVSTPGVHLLSLWVRESNQIVDKILMTTDTALTPSGSGPPESTKVPISSHPAFVRGDANDDSVVDISDSLAVLLFLFGGGSSLTCEDHGDFDDNGVLQVTDAIGILSYLFKGGTPPKAPFPSAGKDTTPDSYDCGN